MSNKTDLLPDFDEMMQLANVIGDLNYKRITLENAVATLESVAVKKATETVLVNGKPPSMEYIKMVIKHPGTDNEILPLRAELASVEAELEKARRLFDVMKAMVSVYQTDSANKRAAIL
jgi:prefoldin subunit 5